MNKHEQLGRITYSIEIYQANLKALMEQKNQLLTEIQQETEKQTKEGLGKVGKKEK